MKITHSYVVFTLGNGVRIFVDTLSQKNTYVSKYCEYQPEQLEEDHWSSGAGYTFAKDSRGRLCFTMSWDKGMSYKWSDMPVVSVKNRHVFADGTIQENDVTQPLLRAAPDLDTVRRTPRVSMHLETCEEDVLD